MDFRKINSYAILLAIVVVVGLLVSMIARFVILEKGADTGTANLVFIIVMGCLRDILSDRHGGIFQRGGFRC